MIGKMLSRCAALATAATLGLLGGCSSSSDVPAGTASSQRASAASGPAASQQPTSTRNKASDPSGTGSSQPSDLAGTGAGVGAGPSYRVLSVVDGDTIKVDVGGRKTTVRLIGVDTPETKKPHVAVQCFGKEASSHMQSLVQSRQVQLVADPSQGDKDKYGRILRYVYVGSTNVALSQIEGGYGREDTYDTAYRFQAKFRAAQHEAQTAHRGTWGGRCNGFHRYDGATNVGAEHSAGGQPAGPTPSARHSQLAPPSKCAIKGNITGRGQKIAHLPGSATYARTRIDKPGERMFCSVQEATAAGWRIAAD